MRKIDHAAKGAGNVGAAVGRQAPKAKHVAKQRDQAISQHISHYAENPRAHSQALRNLGYTAAQLRVVHRNQTRPIYTGPRAAPISDKESAVLSSPAHQAARQKRYAAIDRAYKAPGSDYALGSLGSLGNIVNVATGVDPIHPLRNKIGGSAALNIGLGVASLVPSFKGFRAGAKALRGAKGAEKSAKVAAAATRGKTLTEAEVTSALHRAPGIDSRPAAVVLKDGSRHVVNPLHPIGNGEIMLLNGNLVDARVVTAVHAGDGSLMAGEKAVAAAQAPTAKAHNVKAGEAAAKVPKRVAKMPADMSPEVAASAKKITAALSFGGAKKARAAQEQLYTAERTKRAGAAEEAMRKTPGVEGFHAAKHELKGALPKVEFNALKDKFGDKEVQDLFTHISSSEKLRPYEKVDTHRALQKTLGGEVPTPRERQFLYKTFGPELTKSLLDAAPKLARIKNAGLEIANIPRSLMASADVSAPFRQGLVAGARHPVMFSKNFPRMLKQFGSERIHQETMQLIHEHPLYRDAMDHGLSLTELGPMARREEQFMSNYAEHLPGEHVPGLGLSVKAYNKTGGNIVRASGRAYVGFLDKMRMDMYAYHTEAAQKFYGGALTAEQKHGLSTFINSATGRGDLGRFQNAAVHLNTLFFSPRLLASRFNFLNPAYYAKLDPYSRREALKSMRNLVGFVSSVLYMAKLGGAHVEMDPRNADWAKIKIGNTRIDLLGGFQQPVRLAAQTITGKVISSTTGDTLTLGPGFGKMSRPQIIGRFFRGKLAPTTSMIYDTLQGADFQGNPLSLKNELTGHLIPLAAQDAHDMYHDQGSIPKALASYAGSAVGIGVQTYGPADKTKTAKQASDKLRTALEQNLRQYYQMDVPPQINKALKLREARNVYLAKNLDRNSTAVDRYNAQIDLMVKMKMITPAQSKQAKTWAKGQDKHVVASRTSSLGRMYFGGTVLSSATKKIRARGGHLWLGDY